MLTLSEGFLHILKQASKFLEKNSLPDKYDYYTNKYELLGDNDPLDDDCFCTYIHIDFKKTDIKNSTESIESREPRNEFCKYLFNYLGGDKTELEMCCKKVHLTSSAYNSILNETFWPSKACVFNFIIALKLNFKEAVELLESANIKCYRQNKLDVIMAFFIQNKIYDFYIINTILYLLDLPMLEYYYV